MSLLASALAVFRKDLLSEWRARVAVNALLLFAFSALVLVGYAIGPASVSPEDRPVVHSVLLWLVLFFTAMTGLARVFVREEETGTAAALRLSAPPAAVLLGKLLLNLLLLLGVSALVVPLYLAFMGFRVERPGLFAGALVLGLYGIAAASTFVAAIVAKAAAKGTLFAVLATPLLLPPLVAAVLATRLAADASAGTPAGELLRLLVAYDGLVTTAALMLFDYVFRE